MGKIGLMGGTFNPIHNGHLKLAKAAYEQAQLDEVWFIPSGISYLKKDVDVLPANVRASMVQLAIDPIPYFIYSDIELRRQGNTYTVDTLCELHAHYPEHDFYFIMGADSLAHFALWKDASKIASLCTILVAARNEMLTPELEKYRYHLEQTIQANIKTLDFDPIEMSSSDIRNKIAYGQDLIDDLPNLVEQYIRKYKLYQL